MDIRSIITLSQVPRNLRLACFATVGALAGTAIYLAHISRATSYLSDNPETCINCHVMRPHYASWKHSSHANVATCNDCHVPHDNALYKYAFKAHDGIRHSTIFTLRKEPQVLRATEIAKKVIQANCIRCHASVVDKTNLENNAVHAALLAKDTSRACVDCHREVPHGRAHSLSSAPNALVPDLPRVKTPFFRELNPQD